MSIVGKLLGGGSKQSGTTTTIQSSDPWSGVQPFLTDIFSRGQGLYNSGAGGVAGQSPETLLAQRLQTQRGLMGSPNVSAAQEQNLMTLGGGYSNPYTSGAMGDAMDMARAKINSQFKGDSYGNSAHQEWLGRGITAAGLPFANQAFENERGRQMQAVSQAPGLASQDYMDLGQIGAVGASKDDYAQRQMDVPWQNLQRYQQLISGANPGGGTTNTTQPYFQNKTAEGLGALGSMAAIYKMLPAMGTMFSDVRLKTDIKKVGEREDGLNVYEFRYKGTPEKQVGLMAQEVLMKKPEAVRDIGGLLAVDYGAV